MLASPRPMNLQQADGLISTSRPQEAHRATMLKRKHSDFVVNQAISYFLSLPLRLVLFSSSPFPLSVQSKSCSASSTSESSSAPTLTR